MTVKPNDGSKDVSHLPSQKDAFSLMPIIWGFVLYLVEVILVYDAKLSIFGLLILLGVLIVCLYRGFKHVVQGRYRSAASLILAFLLLFFPMVYLGVVTDNIRFTLNEKQYLEAIKLTQPDEKGFRYKVFNWGTDFFGNDYVLVYDESDELELPAASRSIAWWRIVGGHEGIYSCPYGVSKIKLHFYTMGLHCG